MTPMNNFEYLERIKFSEELAAIESAKKSKGYTYESLAAEVCRGIYRHRYNTNIYAGRTDKRQ